MRKTSCKGLHDAVRAYTHTILRNHQVSFLYGVYVQYDPASYSPGPPVFLLNLHVKLDFLNKSVSGKYLIWPNSCWYFTAPWYPDIRWVHVARCMNWNLFIHYLFLAWEIKSNWFFFQIHLMSIGIKSVLSVGNLASKPFILRRLLSQRFRHSVWQQHFLCLKTSRIESLASFRLSRKLWGHNWVHFTHRP